MFLGIKWEDVISRLSSFLSIMHGKKYFWVGECHVSPQLLRRYIGEYVTNRMLIAVFSSKLIKNLAFILFSASFSKNPGGSQRPGSLRFLFYYCRRK